MIAAAFITRLGGIEPHPFGIVEGAAELAALAGDPPVLPAAYVFVKEWSAEPNSRLTAVLQRTSLLVAVVIVTGNPGDHAGGAAAGDGETLLSAVHQRLLGWTPDGADDVVTYVGGEVVRARGGTVWTEHLFETAILLEAS